ncbi:MAG: HmuY family protein [Deltaproteobacteria bacterium]|nr:HmuY family protein [Deltaproteobacteria bacterium]
MALRTHTRLALALTLLAAAGCAPNLQDDFPFDGALPPGTYATFTEGSDGAFTVNVEATAKEAWVYVDMVQRKDVPAADAVGTDAWHLAFQRFKIMTNSGVSGPGSVEVAALPSQDFDSLTQAPAGGYAQDRADGPDGNADLDSPFLEGAGWYVYDLGVHKLAPRDITYVVHLPTGYFKLRMLNYYARAGTAGTLQFRWAPLLPPSM